jgi:hypothetical protein
MTKGSKRGFFGVVAHYADESGVVIDLLIALLQLTGSHSGDRIGNTIAQTLEEFDISYTKLGYFVLDNAYSNDWAVAYMAEQYQYTAPKRRLRCLPYIFNLIGQIIMFGIDEDAYNNNNVHEYTTETKYLQN